MSASQCRPPAPELEDAITIPYALSKTTHAQTCRPPRRPASHALELSKGLSKRARRHYLNVPELFSRRRSAAPAHVVLEALYALEMAARNVVYAARALAAEVRADLCHGASSEDTTESDDEDNETGHNSDKVNEDKCNGDEDNEESEEKLTLHLRRTIPVLHVVMSSTALQGLFWVQLSPKEEEAAALRVVGGAGRCWEAGALRMILRYGEDRPRVLLFVAEPMQAGGICYARDAFVKENGVVLMGRRRDKIYLADECIADAGKLRQINTVA